MNTNINDILVEWAYRVKDGKPNPKSIRDRIVLESILKDFGWNVAQRDELLRNLTEKRKPGETWQTKGGWAGLKPGEEKARYGGRQTVRYGGRKRYTKRSGSVKRKKQKK